MTVTKKEKAARIGAQLDELYPDPPIPLDHTDVFTLLVAVLLSAQTTDKKVNQVTPALFRRAPDAGLEHHVDTWPGDVLDRLQPHANGGGRRRLWPG